MFSLKPKVVGMWLLILQQKGKGLLVVSAAQEVGGRECREICQGDMPGSTNTALGNRELVHV